MTTRKTDAEVRARLRDATASSRLAGAKAAGNCGQTGGAEFAPIAVTRKETVPCSPIRPAQRRRSPPSHPRRKSKRTTRHHRRRDAPLLVRQRERAGQISGAALGLRDRRSDRLNDRLRQGRISSLAAAFQIGITATSKRPSVRVCVPAGITATASNVPFARVLPSASVVKLTVREQLWSVVATLL